MRVKYLTPDELGQQLQRSIRTLETWRRTGNGPPFIKMGKRVFYHPQDVEAWINKNRFSQHHIAVNVDE